MTRPVVHLWRAALPVVTGLALNLSMEALSVADVVTVVSAKSAVTSLSKHDIADIFLGKAIRFPNGEQPVPIDQEDGTAAHDEFYLKITGQSPAQIKAHWSKVIFTGRGKPPTAVLGGVEARKLVAANPRAIAYIDRSLVDMTIKVVLVK